MSSGHGASYPVRYGFSTVNAKYVSQQLPEVTVDELNARRRKDPFRVKNTSVFGSMKMPLEAKERVCIRKCRAHALKTARLQSLRMSPNTIATSVPPGSHLIMGPSVSESRAFNDIAKILQTLRCPAMESDACTCTKRQTVRTNS